MSKEKGLAAQQQSLTLPLGENVVSEKLQGIQARE